MGAAHPARAQGDGAAGPASGAERLDQEGGGHDIDGRIPGAHLVEGDLRRVRAVHRALGLGEQCEDRERARAHGGRDAGGLQPLAHVGEAHMAVALVCGSGDLEPGAGQRRVPVRVDGDGHRGRKPERIDRCKQPVGKVRAGIEQRRGKHVAGNPADRIEVKAGETVARRRTLRFVRVRVRRYGGRSVVHATATLP